MARNSYWINQDGLAVGYGRHTTSNNVAAVTALDSSYRKTVSMTWDLVDLATAASSYPAGVYARAARIPANAFVHEVRLVTEVAATGATADLLVGTYRFTSAGVLTVVDDDGLVAAADSALANFDTVGEIVTLGASASAAIVGKTTVGANPVTVIPIYVTAAYTAGRIRIEVDYSVASK